MTTEKDAALVALGKQIRNVRQSHGVSQEDFAARARLARAYYGSVERGERNVSAINLMKIAATLGVEVGDLFPKAEEFVGLLIRASNTAQDER